MNRDLNYFLRESGARLTQTLFMEAHYIFSREDLKKMYELIVLECAAIADKGWAAPGTQIKEHFGVEE